MDIESGVLLTLSGTIAGWILKSYNFGKKEQKIQDRLEVIENNQATSSASISALNEKLELEVEKLKLQQASEMEKLRIHHDSDLKEFRTFFTTAEGGQKFITFTDHDGMCERNSRAMVSSIVSLTEEIKNNTKEVAKMNEKYHTMKVEMAVLKERRSTGQRGSDTIEMASNE